MQSTNLPSKYLVPFAKNDGARVELPVTTATAGRASQSLGFPPITGQPPEAGGLAPQLEDFNGAVNQPARVAWWSQLGGKFPFDNTFATDSNINGYPLGAELVSSDNAGTWLSLVENNVANPDTTGTGWVPARAYGVLALTGQTGGTTTPTPVQAMKRRITIAGALTSNLIVILPNWVYTWDITNNTSGAFTVTVKTAAGAGAVIPQNGAPTPILGDGTNIAQPASNIPVATSSTQAAQLSQTTGRLLNVQIFQTAGTSAYAPTAGAVTYEAEVLGGGGSGGNCGTTSSGQVAAGGGGGGGGWAIKRGLVSAISGLTVTVGAGGAAGASAAGGTSSIGSVVTATGGAAGVLGLGATPNNNLVGIVGGGNSSGGDLNEIGGYGNAGLYASTALSGAGGMTRYGGGAPPVGGAPSVGAAGTNAVTHGAGGSGAAAGASVATNTLGGAGKNGLVIIREYA